ncbi:hypothetical protein M758_5G122300 [Ceratodon purpureus]|nr:hypothetical protein M758_N027200 [Ceratodon purpureus]KAG0616524.1 hypothetical protein M758_5G122300 [Ceratodon purpureus]
MARPMMTRILVPLFLAVLASQLAASHGRPVARKATEASYDYADNGGASTLWNTESSFSSQTSSFTDSRSGVDNVDSYASGGVSEDIYVDSPEIVHLDPNSDDVFFDTSNAETVYKAPDHDGLSFSEYNVTEEKLEQMLDALAKAMGGCGTGNPIDDCWRCDPNWRAHRQALASCAVGFGRNALGGKNGPIYVVTNNGDDAQNPAPGTLRYGVTRDGPLWITFAKSMTIQLKAELWVSSYKTIDGRGAEVHITNQVTMKRVDHVILHGLHIHDVRPSGASAIRISPSKVVKKGTSEGDGIHIWGSNNIWVDHCYLAKATDGLVDITKGSTDVTVSNNYLTNHNKVMLLGASPKDTMDRNMRITVAFNKFGPGLVQRLPRARYGVVHVLNNDYSDGWGLYAIGGSEDPTILSQGNHFNAASTKEVTKRISDGGPTFGGWQKWNWASSGDVFLGGAFFTGSGAAASSSGVYAKAFSASSRPATIVPAITKSAGPLSL